tara:strand:+ start:931 stop:2268 length:1338 start_codon:yes stop_codon:yes gene_type:complete
VKNSSIKFINHASVIITSGNTSLLTDPWYYGDAFHKGWNLIVEQSKDDIANMLNGITHIWISHEHPDHFSVKFFLDFKETIIKKSIKIIFQKTKDRRVVNFLKKQKFLVEELSFNKEYKIGEEFIVTCIKDGFYDSALFIKTNHNKILNLNDCEVTSKERANEILGIIGECDILLTQFSYAAWKGGEKNIYWRKLAGEEKLNSIEIQINTFKPKLVIPFASFVYFSNEKNKYLNDSANTPQKVLERLNKYKSLINIMKPFDEIITNTHDFQNNESTSYWSEKYNQIQSNSYHRYDKISFFELNNLFKEYQSRIFKNNNKYMIRIARKLSPVSIFKKITIKLDDINQIVLIDIFSKELIVSSSEPDLIMSSESLKFLLSNSFGFDTLTVNGCFEEGKKGGFENAAKSLAIENLNNMGIYFNLLILFNFQIIMYFFSRLNKVRKKIN